MGLRRRWAAVSAGAAVLGLGGWAWLGGVAVASPGQQASGQHRSRAAARGRLALRRDHGASQDQRLVLNAALAPSVPGDAPIFSAAPGKLPWVITHGRVRLGRGGQLEVSVTGLVVSTTGTNPLPDVAASLYCGGTQVATTAPAPFSPQGNADLHGVVTLPAFCPAPAVLVNPATGSAASDVMSTVYIAFDGIAS